MEPVVKLVIKYIKDLIKLKLYFLKNCNRGFVKGNFGTYLGTCDLDCQEFCYGNSNNCDERKCYVRNALISITVISILPIKN